MKNVNQSHSDLLKDKQYINLSVFRGDDGQAFLGFVMSNVIINDDVFVLQIARQANNVARGRATATATIRC